MADRKISDLTALTAPASGDYLPIVDISEASAANKNKRITIEELLRGAPDGTAAAPSIGFESDPNTGIYSPGADQVAISTGGTGRLFVDASGNVGVGVAAPANPVDVLGSSDGAVVFNGRGRTSDNIGVIRMASSDSATEYFRIQTASASSSLGTTGSTPLIFTTNGTERLRITSTGALNFVGAGTAGSTQAVSFNSSAPVNSLVIDSSGRLGLGTSSPSYQLDLTQDINARNYYFPNGGAAFSTQDGNNSIFIGGTSLNYITLETNNSERARIDSSGRLLVGTSSVQTIDGIQTSIQLQGTTGATSSISAIRHSDDAGGGFIELGKSRATATGGVTVVSNNDTLGTIVFCGADGTDLDSRAAIIRCEVDGTPGNNDMPGRLVFSTTLDGASSPTERMRLNNVGRTTFYSGDGYVTVIRSSNAAGTVNAFLGCTSGATDIDGSGSTLTFQILTNGNVQNTNNSYGAISDLKLKENIVDANSQWNDLKALQVRNYNFKEGQTHTQIGLVAQEVELVSPGLVSESPDRDEKGNDLGTVTKSVNYSVLYMKAVKALQEAMERIEVLEVSNADLLARVTALEAQ